jgi:hypothetical protein
MLNKVEKALLECAICISAVAMLVPPGSALAQINTECLNQQRTAVTNITVDKFLEGQNQALMMLQNGEAINDTMTVLVDDFGDIATGLQSLGDDWSVECTPSFGPRKAIFKLVCRVGSCIVNVLRSRCVGSCLNVLSNPPWPARKAPVCVGA